MSLQIFRDRVDPFLDGRSEALPTCLTSRLTCLPPRPHRPTAPTARAIGARDCLHFARLCRQPVIGARAGGRRHRSRPRRAGSCDRPAPAGGARRSRARISSSPRRRRGSRRRAPGRRRPDRSGTARRRIRRRRASRLPRALSRLAGIPLMPLRRRISREEVANLRGERRRADRFGEDPQAAPLSGACAVSAARMAPRNADHGRISPTLVSVWERSGSYRPSTAACAKTSLAPRLPGCCGLPSIFVGRPSWLSTSSPAATPPSVIAVAKNSGLPGTRSSGWRTYGTIFSGGCRVHAVTPASATDAPISFRNVRRATGSVIASISEGNSLYSRS